MTEALRLLAERVERAVRPFDDYYAVDEDGRVWSSHRGHWVELRPVLSDRGYARLTLVLSGKRKDMRVNRIVAQAWHGPPPFDGAVARHLDDNRTNNTPANIAWGSASDNVADAMRNGRIDPAANGRAGAAKISGERSPLAKLDWSKVREIRALAEDGLGAGEIARRFGLHRSNVNLIVRGKTWKEAARV